jgi:hypothetical protein
MASISPKIANPERATVCEQGPGIDNMARHWENLNETCNEPD